MKVKKKLFMKFQNESLSMEESTFRYNDGTGWSAKTLIEHAEKEKLIPFKLYLNNLNIGFSPFKIDDLYDFISHVKRIDNTDLKYPVIMSETGLVLDGWHRIAKAILAGKKY
jgi:hypothetical protein